MLTREENDLLTQTNRGTPMGDLMRRYWTPALFSEQLPEPDCAPLRVRLLGEDLVGFRDSSGRVGLLGQHCPHRGASLFFGRNEECGLRCVYHGWKFDVSGQCIEMPNEPPESNFKHKIQAAAYPCVERGGIIWTYMGPPDLKPGEPEYAFCQVPPSQRFATRHTQECNWLQALEGGQDTAHVPFLHLGDRVIDRDREGDVMEWMPKGIKFHYEPTPAEYGLLIGQKRSLDADRDSWTLTPFLMPWYKVISPLRPDGLIGYHAWVPIDDEHCMAWSIEYHPSRDITEDELEEARSYRHIHLENIPGTDTTVWNAGNDYGIDRTLQRSRRSFTGIWGVGLQDTAMQECAGPIYDRTTEHLGTSDVPLIAMRKCLLDAVRGGELLGLDPASQHAKCGSVVVPKGTPFLDAADHAGYVKREEVASAGG
ncbi:MAG TPA: Rieske 2Fe-2S domain-containing protein [Chloroflexota bacterium]|nr:Rieske 2Fe-2S domain-containing protein [Chloroflexota bacterium]